MMAARDAGRKEMGMDKKTQQKLLEEVKKLCANDPELDARTPRTRRRLS
jgi:hypothetical protein